jgi:hypothetical protein
LALAVFSRRFAAEERAAKWLRHCGGVRVN